MFRMYANVLSAEKSVICLGEHLPAPPALEAEAPRIVVPGHGSLAGAKVIATVRDYMIDLGRRVKSRCNRGQDADAIVAALGPALRSEHRDWSQPEWVDFAIRYFAATGAAPT